MTSIEASFRISVFRKSGHPKEDGEKPLARIKIPMVNFRIAHLQSSFSIDSLADPDRPWFTAIRQANRMSIAGSIVMAQRSGIPLDVLGTR